MNDALGNMIVEDMNAQHLRDAEELFAALTGQMSVYLDDVATQSGLPKAEVKKQLKRLGWKLQNRTGEYLAPSAR